MEKKELEQVQKLEGVFWKLVDFSGTLLESDSDRKYWDDLIDEWNASIDSLNQAMKK